MKILKDNLPWIAPTVAIVLVATGFFDRETGAIGFGKNSNPAAVAEAAATVAAVAAPTAAETAPIFVAPEPAAVVFAVAEPDVSTAARLAALVEAASTEPEVTRGDASASLATAPLEPAFVSDGVGTGADAAAFFANAQANLTANSACGDDLASLAASSRIYFPSGGLAGADSGLAQARLLGQVLRNCPGYSVRVEGHSDPSGDPAINLRLSQQRADSVVARLAASGIDTSMFQSVGMGDKTPSGVTGIESAAYYDRRVEFTIIEDSAQETFATTAQPWAQTGCIADLQAKLDRARIFYNEGSITVSPSEMDSVYLLAAEAARCDGALLQVVGQHSDATGTREGPATGRLRALAIMNTLVSAGFAADEIIVSAPSWSESIAGQPALPNSRVDFALIDIRG